MQDVPTRWSSTKDMIERLLELRDVVTEVLADHAPDMPNLSEREWDKLKVISRFISALDSICVLSELQAMINLNVFYLRVVILYLLHLAFLVNMFSVYSLVEHMLARFFEP